MKIQFFLLASLFIFITSCDSISNLDGDPNIHLSLPIQERDDIPYVIALADDGKVWQWKHTRGNQVEEIQELSLENVHSIGFLWKHQGWALKSDGTVILWNLENPVDMIDLEEEKKIKKVSGSDTHLTYIFTDGTIGFAPAPFSQVNPVGGLTSLKNVTDITSGRNCTMVCTEDGKVYVAGTNEFYLALTDQAFFEEPYQIEGLSNIVKVGLTLGDYFKYAIDKDNNIFLWGMANTESGIYKSAYKAKDLLPNNLFIKEDGSKHLVAQKGPRMGVMEGLTFLEKTEFENTLYYDDLRSKFSYVEIDPEGQVIYRDLEVKRSNDGLRDNPTNPNPVEGLRLSLRFFEQ